MKTFTRSLLAACALLSWTALAFAQTAPSTVKDEEKKDTIDAYNAEFAAANETVVTQKNAQLSTAAAATAVSMPAISSPASTTSNGTIEVAFDSAIMPSQLNQLWAKVTYNGKTEYWKLDPGMISQDGTKFTMQFDPRFNGTSFKMQLYGFRASDSSKTNLSNSVVFSISSPTTLTMPAISSAATSTSGGTVTCTLASAVRPEQLKDLWATVGYDGKTEYWKLDPGMLSEDGKTFTITFDPKFNGKTVSFALFGYAAADGSQTNTTNALSIKINAASSVTMPSITAPQATGGDQSITFTFSKAVDAGDLRGLWAKVSYDAKTEYWQLDPSLISTDGLSVTMDMPENLIDKSVTLQFYGYTADNGAQTNLSNAVTFTVEKSTSAVTMPVLPSAVSTDLTGKAVVAFSSGSLNAASLRQLWAKVTVDGKTEYWNIGTGALSSDGKSVSLTFDKKYDGKTVSVALFGFDQANIETTPSNAVAIAVTVKSSTVTMPVLPSTAVTDAEGSITIAFSSGTLSAAALSEFYAKVSVNGAASEYWDLGTDCISTDGKSISLDFAEQYDGKSVKMEFFGKDANGVETGYTNAVTITVHSDPDRITMPVLPSTAATNAEGEITLAFASGTLSASALSEFYAKVSVNGGTTEYWDLGTGCIAADGKSITLDFAEQYDGKSVKMEFFGKDAKGVETGYTNAVTITVHSDPDRITMPQIPASATTASDGSLTVAFSSGSVSASSLKELWAEVTVDNKTEYWNIGTDVLAADGKSITLEFDEKYDGKTLQIKFFGVDTNNVETTRTNLIAITVDIKSTTITMPVLPATATTNAEGEVTLAFASGTLSAAGLSEFYAKVNVDGGTAEYWNLGTGCIADDGKSIALDFAEKYDGKSVKMEFFGKDLTGVETSHTNAVTIAVHSNPTRITMPQIPASATTDNTGSVSLAFSSGAVLPGQLNELWAQVTVDNKTEYWNIGTDVLSADGKTITMGFTSAFNNKTLQIRFFGFDTKGIKTTSTNTTFVTVNIPASTIAMPVIPSVGTTDAGGSIQVNFTSGTLTANQLSSFWAEVTYDNKAHYWELPVDILAADGKSLTLELPSELNGKQVKFRFFGFDSNDIITSFTNTLTINSVTS